MAVQICDDSGSGDCAKVQLDDVVRGVQKSEGAKHIRLQLQKKDGTEYGVFLLLPEKFLNKAILAINIGATLRQIGLLNITG